MCRRKLKVKMERDRERGRVVLGVLVCSRLWSRARKKGDRKCEKPVASKRRDDPIRLRAQAS